MIMPSVSGLGSWGLVVVFGAPLVWRKYQGWDCRLWLGGQIWLTTACFCRAHMLRWLFTCLNGWKKNQKIFYDVWKWYEIDISVSVNKILLELSHACSCTCCFLVAPVLTTEELRTCDRDCMWPKSLKYWLCMALDRKFAGPWPSALPCSKSPGGSALEY